MIVRLTGGFANQALMYMFGRSLSIRRNEPVQFHFARSTWDYALEPYNLKIDLAKPTLLNRVYEEPGFAFDSKALEQPSNTYFTGYWQSYKYWTEPETLRQEFTLRESLSALVLGVADQLKNQNSCFVHIRRGDYVSNPVTEAFHGFPGLDYYKQAMDYVREKVANPKFYIFSDDPEWCRQNFQNSISVLTTPGLSQHQDLFLMRNCRHGIGANSTFSWLANWLGEHPERVSIAPKKWFTNPEINTNDLIPEHWIRL